MTKRILLGAGGVVLIGLFLTWMLVKGTDEVQAWTASSDLLSVGMLAVAWVCALGGAGLIARAMVARRPTTDPDS